MLNRKHLTRFRLWSFVLLAGMILASCNQSISRNGESIDSVSAQEAGRIEEENGIKDTLPSAQGSAMEEPGVEPIAEQEPQMSEDVAAEPPGDKREAAGEAQVQSADQQDQPEGSASREMPEPSETQAPSGSSENRNQPEEEQVEETPVEASEPPQPSSVAAADSEKKQGQSEWNGDNKLTFGELYASVGVRGIVLSDKVEALTGKEVEMSGYMAPPLTAGVRFFVLTKALMAVCPFCSTDADWPTDIVVVYLPDGEELKPTEHPVKVTGKLDTGSFKDEDTGFVSLVRIYASKVEVLK